MMQTGTLVVLWALAGSALLLVVSANQEQYERFLLQHVDANPSGRDDKYCNDRMRYMLRRDHRENNREGPIICKTTNTFIHENTNDIRAVCAEEDIGGGLHKSRRSFQITTCKAHGNKSLQNCRYRATRSYRDIVIGCDEEGFPVHLDETRIRVRRGGGASGSS
ncbi:angiogenin-2-like [Alligator sinensis]|uniref:Angiogenin-2-like n=1 Tax=Alligator sinensis TaxID=38654 RepID=A0A1U7SDC1_ALLSI|nr:angiogenin-2-like [Alligator sinensis]